MNDKIGGSDQLDLGAAIQQPFKDPKWFTKCLLIGLMALIPIAGFLNMSGWMRAVADKHLQNAPDKDILPEPNLSYMGAGWRFFLAMLPLLGVLFGGMIICGGIAAAAIAGGGKGGENVMIGMLLLMYGGIILFSLVMQVVMPAVYFLHIVEDEPWASIRFGRLWDVMRQGGTQYLLLFVAVFIGGMIGSLGVIACYVGMFVTLPLGQAIMAKAIADYAHLVRPEKVSFPVDGGSGSASGSPFGVKN